VGDRVIASTVGFAVTEGGAVCIVVWADGKAEGSVKEEAIDGSAEDTGGIVAEDGAKEGSVSAAVGVAVVAILVGVVVTPATEGALLGASVSTEGARLGAKDGASET
jgi:hypothetical protein